MKKQEGLTLVGGVLLIVGLAVALITNHYEVQMMSKANVGVAVSAPKEGTREWAEQERVRREAEWLFWAGVALTGAGVVLQTWGAWLEG